MCTSLSKTCGCHYFGRNLDVEFSFKEQVVITPRKHKLVLRNGNTLTPRYAIIGIASVIDDHPLYYDAANEKGLAIAGLNFPGNAVYNKAGSGMTDIALFELIPWLLGQAGNTEEALALLKDVNITDEGFSGDLPVSPLHFMLSDKDRTVVIEPVSEGLKIYDDPYNVMTNNPPFSYHLWNIRNYMNLSPENIKSTFSSEYPLPDFGVGMGAYGLPGDCSSASRFVRAAFNLTNSDFSGSEEDKVAQFFHVLDSVAMTKGAVKTNGGKNDITLYSCCINTSRGIYYYKTYGNNRINAIDMFRSDLDSDRIYIYDLEKDQDIKYGN